MRFPEYAYRQSPQVQIPNPSAPNLPEAPPSGAAQLGTAIAGVGQAIGENAVQWAQIEATLQKQKDDLEIATLTGQYDAAVEAIKLTLTQDPNYLGHEAAFTRQVSELQENVISSTQRPPVQQALRARTALRFPKEAVEVRATALKLFGESQLAQLDRIEEDLSKRTAEATLEVDRNDAIQVYEALIRRARERGFLNPLQEQQKRRSFTDKVLEKQMDVLRRTDRSTLYRLDREGAFTTLDPVKRLKILESARVDGEREIQQDERVFKQAQDVVERDWSAQANQGKLSDTEIERALIGQHPFITPDKARQYKTINENPLTGGTNLPIRIIMQEYHSGPSVQTRIDATRQQLKVLQLESGQPNKLLDAAFGELQTDERTMRGVRAQEISAGIKLAEDDYRTKVPTVLPGKLGQMQRNQQAADLAEIRNKIRRGAKPEKAVEDSLKRRKTEGENLPNRTRNILELAD